MQVPGWTDNDSRAKSCHIDLRAAVVELHQTRLSLVIPTLNVVIVNI